jgi:hypothetical protein
MELSDANKCELALLAGEWLTRRESYYRLQDAAERAEKEMDEVKERLRDKLRTFQGCSEDEWKQFVRWAFNATRLEKVMHGHDDIHVFSDLIGSGRR